MILTVTLNAALDLTYEVDAIRTGQTHRVQRVQQRAGGKGLNVARVLHALGQPVLATGLVGGPTGAIILADLAAAGVPADLVEVSTDSRRTVAVVSTSDGDATMFTEPGDTLEAEDWQRFLRHYRHLASAARVVVLSGSLPPGLPEDSYAQLARLARDAGAHTILDSDGPPLTHGLAGRPDIVKPNAAELRAATGLDDPIEAAAALRTQGAGAVVASLGPAGLLAVTRDGTWRAAPPARIDGNPTGAGDAGVAALAAGALAGSPWPDRLREAVALSAATVAHPQAGSFDEPTYRLLLGQVQVTSHA
ncbi:1-phosphofructokinase family hexose kinase [Solihabitans fulvus]|uniref:1-phosphofructokinase family hexose kinase n=1 Tax=Solihabitans fulvus TaxID=1892852 RepID=A0A5B2WRH0_9PSEU|nr:1-phosphofructokinase family hexose kinase [Solihabitans fulvus]KAA2254095.1 1-phosphofructokinase family hexose kinase [Solihabitans fulvus]